jgi:hypothetical protein
VAKGEAALRLRLASSHLAALGTLFAIGHDL